MKKILLLIFISLLASCSNNESSPNSQISASPTNITASNTQPSVDNQAAKVANTSITTNVDSQSAKVAEILDGDQVFIQERKAAVNDVAKSQERVRTGESSAEIEFSNNAIARMSKNSLLTLGNNCGAQLQKGSVLINGAVSVCTSSINTAVRGTTYLLEIDEAGDDRIQVLEGEVEISRKDDPKAQIQTVRSGERLRYFRVEKRSEIQKISQEEYETLLKASIIKGYKRELPSRKKVKSKFHELFPKAKPVLENGEKNDLKKSEVLENGEKPKKNEHEKVEREEKRENLDDKVKKDLGRKNVDDKPKDISVKNPSRK
jgi:hypothetical protein